MPRISATLAALTMAVGIVAAGSPAQAAPGDQMWSCGAVPSGWVVLAYGGTCTTPATTRASYQFIQQAEGMPAGNSLTVCAWSSIPAGWHVVYGPVPVGQCTIGWGSPSPNALIISNS
jgi:hypothetical protein